MTADPPKSTRVPDYARVSLLRSKPNRACESDGLRATASVICFSTRSTVSESLVDARRYGTLKHANWHRPRKIKRLSACLLADDPAIAQVGTIYRSGY